jgi:DUF4097 and DUF4098 domain-containing protein YvlB
MRTRIKTALTAIVLLSLTTCVGGSTTTDDLSYQIDQPVTALIVDARAASVAITVGDGPVTVTEEHRYSRSKPTTAHQVDGQTLRLTESGCGDDDARCDVGYTIRMPKATSADITAQAGAVKVDGLAGDVHVTTQAGAVEGRSITSDEVTVKTEAGATSLEFAQAPTLVRATTSAGAIKILVPGTTAYAVDVQTSVGASSIDVDKDPSSAHRIEVHTDVGAVQIEPVP